MVDQASVIRVVVFTGGPVLDRQVATFLGRLENDPKIELAGIFSQSPLRGTAGMIRDLWERRGLLAVPLVLGALWSLCWYEIASPRAARRNRKIRQTLHSRIHYVNSLHRMDVVASVRDLKPGLGLVYGGPIIKPELFEIPVKGTLGIHHGKVPEYRGKKTTFWAMYNGEDEVGVTIQRIGSSLDGGDIVMQARLPVAKRSPGRVKRQLEDTGINLYVRAIHAVRKGSASYTAQPEGQAVLYTDPGVIDIIRFWYGYLLRLIRN